MFPVKGSSFALSGLGAGFANRQKDLFASLDAAEKEREEKCKNQPRIEPIIMKDTFVDCVLPVNSKKRRTDPKQFRGKESIFKRPEMPPPRRARPSLPDHQRNPHKWTRYSLGDVSPQDMSERSNTVAALSFLRELQARKDCTDTEDSVGSITKPVTFKPSKLRNEQSTGMSNVSTTETSEEAERPSFRSSKLVMPEYVVGQKKDKKKKLEKKMSDKPDRNKEIKLGHLEDEEDE